MRRPVLPSILLACCLLAGTAVPALSQRVRSRLPAADGWTDPTPHRAGYVTVERGVRIHYLDFGGTGPVVFLLAGIGNTAHAYDDFAPGLTDRYRVIAMTRRGFGESSHPEKGYDLPRLTLDIKTVMDSLRLDRVDLIGHSFAGQEMTHFVRRWPAKIRKLVYLDGAFDNIATDSVAQAVYTTPMEYPAKDSIRTRDTSSFQAYTRYIERTRGVRIPEGDTRVRVRYDGIIEELGVGYQGISLEASIERQEWEKLRHPALGIFASVDSFEQSEPWVRADRSWRDRVQAVIDKSRLVTSFAVADFKRAPRAEAMVISGGHHWIFVSHRAQVLEAVRAFLAR